MSGKSVLWKAMAGIGAALVITAGVLTGMYLTGNLELPFVETPTPIVVATPILASTVAPNATTPTPGMVTPTSRPPAPGTPITLTVWLPDSMFPDPNTADGKLLKSRLEDFRKAHAGISVEVDRKLPYGKGGMLEYLRTAHSVAPKVLPDVAVIDVQSIDKAVSIGALQPVENLIPQALRKDMYGFARSAGVVGEHQYMLFLQAKFEHAAVNQEKCNLQSPTWEQLFKNGCIYLFPAAGATDSLDIAIISHYLGAGGSIDQTRSLKFEEKPLRRLFSFYTRGRDSGVIPASVLKLSSSNDTWREFLAEKGTVAHVDSHQFLVSQGLLHKVGFMPIPTYDGRMVAIAQGWGAVIVTPSARKQEAAMELLKWLMQPDWYGKWCEAAKMLPVTASGMKYWHQAHGESAYGDFLDSLLKSAISQPAAETFRESAVQLENESRKILQQPSADVDKSIQKLITSPKG